MSSSKLPREPRQPKQNKRPGKTKAIARYRIVCVGEGKDGGLPKTEFATIADAQTWIKTHGQTKLVYTIEEWTSGKGRNEKIHWNGKNERIVAGMSTEYVEKWQYSSVNKQWQPVREDYYSLGGV